MATLRTVKQQVDRLGELKASIAMLTIEADALVLKLKARGLGVYSGTLFDANIFATNGERTDWKGLANEVGFTVRQKNKHTVPTSTVTCKVTARLSRPLAALENA